MTPSDTTPQGAEPRDDGVVLDRVHATGLIERFDVAYASQNGSPDAQMAALANYGEAALNTIRAGLRSPAPAAPTNGEGESVEDLWQELCERDDRTSPEEYPEMCLITFDELSDFIQRAALQPHPTQQGGTEAAFREGYEVGYCDGQAFDPTNDVDASWATYLAALNTSEARG